MIDDPHFEEIITIEGKRIPVWVYGNKKNYPIVFIHGYFRGFSDYIGDLPMRYLAKDCCIYCFDLPGFGKSREVSIDNVRFVNSLIEKLLLKKKFTLFGVSYGGVIALKYAAKFPAKVDSIIVAGTPFGGIFNIVRFGFLPKIFFPTLSRFITDYKFMNKINLSKISIPVLLLYGNDDTRATVRMGNNLLAVIKKSRITVAKRTHAWLLHRIDENGFQEAIENFLKPFVNR